MKLPSASVMAVRATPVARLVTVTVTPGITPPDASRTMPTMDVCIPCASGRSRGAGTRRQTEARRRASDIAAGGGVVGIARNSRSNEQPRTSRLIGSLCLDRIDM